MRPLTLAILGESRVGDILPPMEDWISQLQPGQRALDMGSGAGSFPVEWFSSMVVALDEDPDAFRANLPAPASGAGPYCRVVGTCSALPFSGGSTAGGADKFQERLCRK